MITRQFQTVTLCKTKKRFRFSQKNHDFLYKMDTPLSFDTDEEWEIPFNPQTYTTQPLSQPFSDFTPQRKQVPELDMVHFKHFTN